MLFFPKLFTLIIEFCSLTVNLKPRIICMFKKSLDTWFFLTVSSVVHLFAYILIR